MRSKEIKVEEGFVRAEKNFISQEELAKGVEGKVVGESGITLRVRGWPDVIRGIYAGKKSNSVLVLVSGKVLPIEVHCLDIGSIK